MNVCDRRGLHVPQWRPEDNSVESVLSCFYVEFKGRTQVTRLSYQVPSAKMSHFSGPTPSLRLAEKGKAAVLTWCCHLLSCWAP